MPMYNVYDRTEEVMNDTWGHMKPKAGRKYYGYMFMYYSFNGHFGILDWHYEGLEGSPWQYDHFNAWVNRFIDDKNKILNSGGEDIKPGVHRYDGWYKAFKNGRCQFQEKEWRLVFDVENI